MCYTIFNILQVLIDDSKIVKLFLLEDLSFINQKIEYAILKLLHYAQEGEPLAYLCIRIDRCYQVEELGDVRFVIIEVMNEDMTFVTRRDLGVELFKAVLQLALVSSIVWSVVTYLL